MLIPNAPAVEEMAESGGTVPEGTYNLRMHKATYVPVPKSKDAKGPYVRAQWVISGPDAAEQFKGRMVFQNYTLTGDGSFRLREMLTVTGHPTDFRLTDTDQLHNLECGAAVIVKEDPGYAPKNEIKKHLPLL